ncbi:MAG: hypothetical protein KIT16_10525 [Rhodospirillaceae bacterium]|nr:hypothetical protein [Rhodospirillaceae bacterium]
MQRAAKPRPATGKSIDDQNFFDYNRSTFLRTPRVFSMRAESETFARLLPEEFPSLRIVSIEYWKRFVDWAAYEARCAEDRKPK